MCVDLFVELGTWGDGVGRTIICFTYFARFVHALELN